jgi:adenylate cyclase
MLRGRLGITSALAARDYLDRSGLDPAHYAGAGRASARLGPDRSLRVIMVADIVQSTATNVRLGDEGWVRILDVHDATVRDALARHGGVAVKHTGDGVLATFPSASDALLCASDIVASCPITHPAMPEATLEICVGLSAGEPIVIDDDLRGQAVTEAFRICGHADVREILVSADVVELYRGNAFGFEAHGEFELKGWPAPRRLHRALPVATASVNAFT